MPRMIKTCTCTRSGFLLATFINPAMSAICVSFVVKQVSVNTHSAVLVFAVHYSHNNFSISISFLLKPLETSFLPLSAKQSHLNCFLVHLSHQPQSLIWREKLYSYSIDPLISFIGIHVLRYPSSVHQCCIQFMDLVESITTYRTFAQFRLSVVN